MLNRARLSDSNFVAPKPKIVEVLSETESIDIDTDGFEEKSLGETGSYKKFEELFMEICQAAAESWLDVHADEILERILSQHVMQPLKKKRKLENK
jgi:hypothetical protein